MSIVKQVDTDDGPLFTCECGHEWLGQYSLFHDPCPKCGRHIARIDRIHGDLRGLRGFRS